VADPSFYPLTFPIIVGPGTIATLILLVSGAQGDRQSGERAAAYLSVGLAVVAVLMILGVVLYFAGNIGHFLSQTLRTIKTASWT
jgi:multiple antibiotic resistance protein